MPKSNTKHYYRKNNQKRVVERWKEQFRHKAFQPRYLKPPSYPLTGSSLSELHKLQDYMPFYEDVENQAYSWSARVVLLFFIWNVQHDYKVFDTN